MISARLPVPEGLPATWLRRELERHIAMGGAITDPLDEHRVVAIAHDLDQNEDGFLLELEVLDEKTLKGLDLGIGYTAENEARLVEIFPDRPLVTAE